MNRRYDPTGNYGRRSSYSTKQQGKGAFNMDDTTIMNEEGGWSSSSSLLGTTIWMLSTATVGGSVGLYMGYKKGLAVNQAEIEHLRSLSRSPNHNHAAAAPAQAAPAQAGPAQAGAGANVAPAAQLPAPAQVATPAPAGAAQGTNAVIPAAQPPPPIDAPQVLDMPQVPPPKRGWLSWIGLG